MKLALSSSFTLANEMLIFKTTSEMDFKKGKQGNYNCKQGHIKVTLDAEVFARHPRGFRMAGTLPKSIVQKSHVVISSLILTENVELLC